MCEWRARQRECQQNMILALHIQILRQDGNLDSAAKGGGYDRLTSATEVEWRADATPHSVISPLLQPHHQSPFPRIGDADTLCCFHLWGKRGRADRFNKVCCLPILMPGSKTKYGVHLAGPRLWSRGALKGPAIFSGCWYLPERGHSHERFNVQGKWPGSRSR